MAPTEQAASRLRRWIGLALAVLVGTSWPLWTAATELPQIPWSGLLVSAPRWIDSALLLLLLVASVAAVLGPSRPEWTRTIGFRLWLVLSGLILLDQHRLQPWAYEFWLLLGVFSLADAPTALRCSRAVVVSVYVWSGVSKIDPGFVAGHGQMLLDGLLQSVGLADAAWNNAQRSLAVSLMPAAELLIALLLVLPRWRRFGLGLSIGLHLVLLLAVGPWGLDHKVGVLLWNVYFIGQNLLLFGASSRTAVDAVPSPIPDRKGDRLAVGFTVAAVLAPLLNPIGYWDHWPSWSVYSAHPAIVRMYVAEADVSRLPESLQPLVLPPEPLQSWRQVPLEQWSFAEREVPPYPQSRWKLALAAAIAEQAGLEEGVRLEVQRRASWWKTDRTIESWTGREAIEQARSGHWINTLPRN